MNPNHKTNTPFIPLWKRAQGIGMTWKGIQYFSDKQGALAFAETYHLRYSRAGDTLCWLLYGPGNEEKEYFYANITALGAGMDHVTGWNWKGKPAVLVAQPYHLEEGAFAFWADIARKYPLHIEIRGDSFYNPEALILLVWRQDVLDAIHADTRERLAQAREKR